MFFFVGLAVVFGAVFGGYVIAGGKMAPIIKAAPIETFIIAGAAIAAMLTGNSLDIFKGAFAGIGKCFKGPKYKKDDYLQTIFLVSKLMKVLKAEGAVALEAHIENPDSSAIFAEYPPILKDHDLQHLITDTIRFTSAPVLLNATPTDSTEADANPLPRIKSAVPEAWRASFPSPRTTNATMALLTPARTAFPAFKPAEAEFETISISSAAGVLPRRRSTPKSPESVTNPAT